MIPSLLLTAVKDVLRIPSADTAFDARLQSSYEQALQEWTRETDLLVSTQEIAAVEEQSLYAAPDGTTRVLAVFHNGTHLLLVPSRSLDLLSTWQTAASGDPQEWTMDKVPPGLDGASSISPLQFAVHPAPDTDGSGEAGLLLLHVGVPSSDAPPAYMTPYLIYKTAAMFVEENTEERDVQAGQLWEAIAGVWRELITG